MSVTRTTSSSSRVASEILASLAVGVVAAASGAEEHAGVQARRAFGLAQGSVTLDIPVNGAMIRVKVVFKYKAVEGIRLMCLVTAIHFIVTELRKRFNTSGWVTTKNDSEFNWVSLSSPALTSNCVHARLPQIDVM